MTYPYTQDWQCLSTTIKWQNSYNPYKELDIFRHRAICGQSHPAIVLQTLSKTNGNVYNIKTTAQQRTINFNGNGRLMIVNAVDVAVVLRNEPTA